MKEIYYSLKRGVLNIIHYLPFVWGIKPWDTKHIYHMMRFQLTTMLKQTNDVSKENIDKIMTCQKLLKNKIKDDYVQRIDFNDPKPFLLFVDKDLKVIDGRTQAQISIDEKIRQKADELRDNEWQQLMELLPTIK